MICPNCKQEVKEGLSTCPYCNNPLDVEMNYQQFQNPTPTYTQAPVQEIIRPKKQSNVGKIIVKVFTSLIGLVILCVLILLLTTRHLYCRDGSKRTLILYTNQKLLWCLSSSKEDCLGFDNAKPLANEGNINAIMDSLKEYYVKEGASCKLK